MFGHDDKEEKQKQADDDNVVQPMSTTPPDENLVGITDDSGDDATVADPVDDEDGDIGKIVDDINDSADKTDLELADEPKPVPISEPEDEKEETPPAATINVDSTPSDLVEIKKSALQELSPLLDELDQTPEAKLNILMMTIQASDDQSLIPQAFETAKKIEGKKPRAEAMLDIINEINYFTKKSS